MFARTRQLPISLVLLLVPFLLSPIRGADDLTVSNAPSLQQQLDDLKDGQRKILEELESIRAILNKQDTPTEYAARAPMTNVVMLNVHGEAFRGSSTARVAIVEYSDFSCPFCARFAREIFPKIDQEYVQSGKIKYYFRDLPDPIHTNAMKLAQAARCAGEQGKFWEMHDRLFATEAAGETPNVESIAQSLGLDLVAFRECANAGRYSEAIRRSTLTARRAGIQGTPAFVIGTLNETGDFLRGTRVLLGAEDFEAFREAIEQATIAK